MYLFYQFCDIFFFWINDLIFLHICRLSKYLNFIAQCINDKKLQKYKDWKLLKSFDLFEQNKYTNYIVKIN
jgi:hypothetical protein